MRRHIFAKLKKKAGESLSETLIALLIAAMSMIIMAGALVAAAKTNDAAKRVMPFSGHALEDTPSQNVNVTFGGATSEISIYVTEYDEEGEDKNIRSVYYYEAK